MVLQSYLLHHPDWSATIYTTKSESRLISSALSEIIELGYDLTVEQLNIDNFKQWFSNCPFAIAWITRRRRWKKYKFYNSHLTDLIRFCLIYEHGGVYADLDALLLKPFGIELYMKKTVCYNSKKEGCLIIGMDDVGPASNNIDLTWTINQGKNYVAPGLIIGQKLSPVIFKALEFGFNHKYYQPLEFNHAGPKAITKAYKLFRGLVNLLPVIEFYPVNYISAPQLFKQNCPMNNGLINESFLYNLAQTSTSLHFFGSRTDHMRIEENSVMDLLLQKFEKSRSKIRFHAPLFYQMSSNKELVKLNNLNFMCNNLRLNITANDGMIVSERDGTEASSLIIEASKSAELNNKLSRTFYKGSSYGAITISGTLNDISLDPHVIPLYNIPNLVTIVIKTMNRMNLVLRLIDSIRSMYPQVPIVVGNDSSNSFDEAKKFEKHFCYIPLPFDVGLSEGRNLLIKRVKTPYFFIIDDDFIFSKGENGHFSDLGLLIHALSEWNFDIASGSSPVDIEKNGFAYQGVIRLFKNTLLLSQKKSDGSRLCYPVDIVPNIFMGRTNLFKNGFISWDKKLKLAEHEKFFIIAKKKGIKVGYCPSSAFIHGQNVKEHESPQYLTFRNRVYNFLAEVLKEMKVFKLITFGFLTMNIKDIKKKVKEIFLDNLQPSSVWVSWLHEDFCHRYQIEILKSHDGSADSRKHHHQTLNIWPRSSSRIQKSYWLNGLHSDTLYTLRVIPGNYTDILEEYGKEITFRTLPYKKNNYLHNFDSKSFQNKWKSLMNHFHLQYIDLNFPTLDSILSYNNFDEPLPSGFFKIIKIPVRFHKRNISINLGSSIKPLGRSPAGESFAKLGATVLTSDGLEISFEDVIRDLSARNNLSLNIGIPYRTRKRIVKLKVEILNYSRSTTIIFHKFYCGMNIINSG